MPGNWWLPEHTAIDKIHHVERATDDRLVPHNVMVATGTSLLPASPRITRNSRSMAVPKAAVSPPGRAWSASRRSCRVMSFEGRI